MKLKFDEGYFSDDLFYELGFSEYLTLFNLSIPMLENIILSPLSYLEANKLFSKYEKIKELSNQNIINLDNINNTLSLIPNLDLLLKDFKENKLEQFHFFSLGQFLINNIELYEIEDKAHVDLTELDKCETVLNIIRKYFNKSISCLTYTEQEEKLKEDILILGQKLSDEINTLETEILNSTNLKLIYPFPKEIDKSDSRLDNILKCVNLLCNEQKDIYQIDFSLPKNIKNILSEKENLQQKLFKSSKQKIIELNNELIPNYDSIESIYQKRKQESFVYAITNIALKNNLCFPKLTSSNTINLKNAILPTLKNIQDSYEPLSISLEDSGNLLYGPNMSGKSTVLKTIFFHLTLISMGLPVPAQEVTCKFPEHVKIHIKSSGNLKNNLSTFGEEIDFFSQTFSDNSYILVDEFFSSTTPTSGEILSKIILEEFNNQDVIFLASTQLSNVILKSNNQVYKMNDHLSQHVRSDFSNNVSKSLNFDTLLKLQKEMPYTVKKVENNSEIDFHAENIKPLQIALHFKLNQKIKSKISKYLKDIK